MPQVSVPLPETSANRRSRSMQPMELSVAQRFEIERIGRAIDATTDVATLQGIAKQLLHTWQVQRAATTWMMRQTLPRQQNAPATEMARAPVRPNQNSSS
jgi:hypothetical protein